MKYWAMRVFVDDEDWDENCRRCFEDGLIPLGYAQFGDLSELDWDGRVGKIKNHGLTEGFDFTAGTFERFYNQAKIGDTVILRRGKHQVAGVGKISGKAFYDPHKSDAYREIGYVNFLPVEWQKDFEVFKAFEFFEKIPPIWFMGNISEEQFQDLMKLNLS